MSFQEIGNALYTQILELKIAGRLTEVYNYDVRVEEAFTTPCAIITPADSTEDILDTAYNEVIMPFHVKVIDEGSENRAEMEDNIRDLVDVVTEKIKDMAEVSYSNGATKRKTYKHTWWWTNTPIPMRMCEILIEFLAVEDK